MFNTEKGNARSLLIEGEEYFNKGSVSQAIKFGLRAYDISPHDYYVCRYLSSMFAASHDYEKAIEFGLKALEVAPDNLLEIHIHLAGLYMATKNWREAAKQLFYFIKARVPITPELLPVAWRQLSTAMIELGQTQRALEAIEEAIALSPEEVEYRLHYASLISNTGRYGDALNILSELVSQYPDDARVWSMRSGIYETLYENSQALFDIQKAIGIEPENKNFQIQLNRLKEVAFIKPADDEHVASLIDEWAPRIRRTNFTRSYRKRTIFTAVKTQGRVIFSLMLRETRTRFGHTRLGYVWALVEPISHLLTLGSVFSLFNHSPPPVGSNLFLYYLTGLLPYLLFGHVSQEVSKALTAGTALMQLPIVKRLDIIAARALLNLTTEVIVGIIVFFTSFCLGEQGIPHNFLVVFYSVISIFCIATGIGCINIVMESMFSSWDTVFQSFNRLLYFGSGIYYSPISMPSQIRDVLTWNPILQCIEWFRNGFYANYEPHWLSRSYIILWAVGCLLIGLTSERATRKLVRISP